MYGKMYRNDNEALSGNKNKRRKQQMKMQKKNTFIALLICTIMLVGMTQMSFAQMSTSNAKTLDPSLPQDAACLEKIQQDEKSKYASFDQQKALSSALGYDKFKSEVQGDSVSNGHIVMIWSYDPVNCNATAIGASVQFMVTDATGHKRNVIVSEDPKNPAPIDVSVDKDIRMHTVPTAYNTIWSGYELTGNSAGTNGVYQAALTYVVPPAAVPSLPSGFTCGTTASQQCDASVWSGIAKSSGGNNGLVQTGTDSICSGTSGTSCVSTIFHAWLEFYDSSNSANNVILDCAGRPGNLVPKSGDSVMSQVTNEYVYGSGTKYYDLYLDDITQNIQCSSIGVSFNSGDKGTPYYAEYILERPTASDGKNYRLDGFGTISNAYGTIWYSGTNNGIYVPFNAGYGTKIIMQNGGVSNTSVSDVNTSSRFNLSWLTSANTN